MENEHFYDISFADECKTMDGRIYPSTYWKSFQIPLKSLESAEVILKTFEEHGKKFTRFWTIIKYTNAQSYEETVKVSPLLKEYLKCEETKRIHHEETQYNKVEELNKKEGEKITIRGNFYGLNIFILRGRAIFNPKISKNIKRFDVIKFENASTYFSLSSYIGEGGRLLKKKFYDNYKCFIPDCPREEFDNLLSDINSSYKLVRKEIE